MTLRELSNIVESFLVQQKENFLTYVQEVGTVMFWEINWLDASLTPLITSIFIWLAGFWWMWKSTESVVDCLPEDKRNDHPLKRYGPAFALVFWLTCTVIASNLIENDAARATASSVVFYIIGIYSLKYLMLFIYDGKQQDSDWQ